MALAALLELDVPCLMRYGSCLGIQRAVSRAQVRGRGLMNAVVVREDQAPSAWDICMRLMQNGLLAKPTHGNIIRLAPPLTLTEEQVLRGPLKP